MKYLIVLLLLAACTSSISQDDAVDIAEDFVRERVKFFAVNESDSVDIEEYVYEVQEVTFSNDQYAVTLHITGRLGNETKQGDMLVIVNSDGTITNVGKRH